MAIKYYNQPPYYDDFDQTKNYLRVLFRPGYAVQARELTQLQTAIQAQIDRFGSYIFKDGKRVIGAESVLDTKYAYVKLKKQFTYSATDYYPEGDGDTLQAYYQKAVDQIVTGQTNNVTAKVIEAVHSTLDDSLTLYVNYTSAGDDNTTHFFAEGEILEFVSETVTYYFQVEETSPTLSAPLGFGTRFSITEGVFFVKGNFVYTPAESVIVSKYTTNPSARIVYAVTESVVTPTDDPTLSDNSLGTPNASAPGAYRYQIDLNLTTQPYADSDRTEENIIQLMIVRGGYVVGMMGDELSEIAKTMATRTYEESGNYTVNPFVLNVREYYNDGTNGGLYSATQILNQQDVLTEADAIAYGKERLAVALEPGIAYVKGFRVQTLDTRYIPVLKARDEKYIDNKSMLCKLGGYVLVDTSSIVGVPNITTFGAINLISATSSPTVIGTARARGFRRHDSTTHELYLFDISMNTNRAFSEVGSVADATAGFSADLTIVTSIGYAQIQDTANNSLLYKLPVNAVKTLKNLNNQIEVTYRITKSFSAVKSGNTLTLTGLAANEYFESTNENDYVVVNASGAIVPLNNVTLSSGLTQAVLTLPSGSPSGTYKVIAPVVNSGSSPKTKTLHTSEQITIASPNLVTGAYDLLGKCDLVRIRSVHMSANFNTTPTVNDVDIADRYELDNGQRENFYDVGRIVLKTGSSKPTGKLLVVFDYFEHINDNGKNYFCVDSYPISNSFTYEDIPSFNSTKGVIQLRDAIDFRPRKNDAGTAFTGGSGASTSYAVLPDSVFTTDYQYYLPRTDKIYVNQNGEFGVQYGVSSDKPKLPETPADSMLLYTLSLNAYTFGTKDLSTTFVDNRRYTMRDIGRLEKRIANVEYYTSLSLLEKDTANKQIFDGAQPRYKNGFVADPFNNHGIGAVEHPDYNCAIDIENNTCRPRFYQDRVDLTFNAIQSVNVKRTGSLVTLNYREVPMIQQPYASDAEYINPHTSYSWKGTIQLSPPGDDWIDTTYLPDETKTVSNSNAYNSIYVPAVFGWGVYNRRQGSNAVSSNNYIQFATTQQQAAAAAAGMNDAFQTNDYYIGAATVGSYVQNPSVNYSTEPTDKIVSSALIQNIRSRKIYFKATGLKPNSRVYAFFDGIDVSAFVKTEASFIEYYSNPASTLYTGFTEYPSPSPVNNTLISDASGQVIGSFVIPCNDTLKFQTGERKFRLIDNNLNDLQTANTYADATYVAKGTLETHQRTVISTAQTTVVANAAPVSTAYQAPAAPTVSISVEGKTPKYIGIPFNLVAQGTSSTSRGLISKIEVWGRSGNPDATAGTWVKLGEQMPNSFATSLTVRESQTNQQGQYQWKAVITVNGTEYESAYITKWIALLPDSLKNVTFSPTDSRFYE